MYLACAIASLLGDWDFKGDSSSSGFCSSIWSFWKIGILESFCLRDFLLDFERNFLAISELSLVLVWRREGFMPGLF